MGEPTAGVAFRVIERGTDEFEASRSLRYRVMYEPFDLDPGFVDVGEGGLHMGGFEGGRLVAYGRLSVDRDGRGAALYQVVVESGRQRSGVGRQLVEALLALASDRGLSHVRLDARVEAVGFYEALGFSVTGDVFRNPTGLPHKPMLRVLA